MMTWPALESRNPQIHVLPTDHGQPPRGEAADIFERGAADGEIGGGSPADLLATAGHSNAALSSFDRDMMRRVALSLPST
jgi:hypothetical protein